MDLMERQLARPGQGRVEPLRVKLVLDQQALDLTRCQWGPTPLKELHLNLREVYPGMFGDPIESSVYDAPGQREQLERRT